MVSSAAVGSIIADVAAMRALAEVMAQVGTAVSAAAAACGAASDDLALAASAAVDPVRAARIEWGLFDVRDGLGGLRLAGLELTGLRVVLDLAATTYQAADVAVSDAQNWLTRHPGEIDRLIHGITAATGLSEQQVCGWLTRFYPDGRPQVRPLGVVPGDPSPRSIADLVATLGRRATVSNRWSAASAAAVAALPPGADDGTIDVRRLTGPHGTAWVVDLPGTSSWDLPGPPASPSREHDPADFGGDLRLMAGEPTVYERGIVDAVTSLPVRPGQPILLAGHSEGGMVAMAVAGVLAAKGLTMASVLTAGSPIAGMAPPAGTDVLALENSDDIVPHLDGASNPRAPDWATLSFTDSAGGIGADHGFGAYAVGAAQADRSTDPAVERWRAGARPFLTATAARTWAFRLQREP
jgi:hypothetical protein